MRCNLSNSSYQIAASRRIVVQGCVDGGQVLVYDRANESVAASIESLPLYRISLNRVGYHTDAIMLIEQTINQTYLFLQKREALVIQEIVHFKDNIAFLGARLEYQHPVNQSNFVL